jgi:methyl-accepting chemotaxis protein
MQTPVSSGIGAAPAALPVRSELAHEADATRAELAALHRSLAVIEFELDGTIREANANFCSALGYAPDEIVGRHHSLFVDPAERTSSAYRQFWADLASGRFQSGEFRRIAKGGREIWIQATYNPVLDAGGRPYKVIKFASDITAQKQRSAESQGQLSAISKSMAVIEFELDGTIRSANENFCNALGYSSAEIVGQHHRMFVAPSERERPEYQRFWAELGAGRFQSGEYQRIAKGGREIWIQATYNPIFDASGKPVKVVKFALDVTAQVLCRQRNERIVEQVRATAHKLSGSAGELTQVTGTISSNAERSSDQARSVAAASEQLARNNQTVASAIEEMGASIRSISGSTADAAKVASSAVATSRRTNETVIKLGDSSREIGKVIKTITEIAAQTNLLALNATIESARAGEAGKGFAVVANEVKQLAKQSAQASEDIARRIESIQSDTKSAVQAIAEIVHIIEEISGLQNSIAGAVEEQTAVTSEMARNVTEAVEASHGIARSINTVSEAAASTAEGVRIARTTAADVGRMAVELEQAVR